MGPKTMTPRRETTDRRDMVRGLRRDLVVTMVLVTIGSVCMFALVEFFVYRILGRDGYDPIDAIGMIFPVGLILVPFTLRFLGSTEKRLRELARGLSEVSRGHYGTVLDTRGAGHYGQIYRDFNSMSRELRAVQTLRDDFVNQFSHEFRTPVMSIHGFATLMKEEELPREEQLRYLSIIASESRRLGDLSRNTLLLADLESREWLATGAAWSMDEQIRECIALLGPSWEARHLRMEAFLAPAWCHCHRDLLAQVWINLLSNAVAHVPDGGWIRVESKVTDGQAEVLVRDSGPGIPAEHLGRIFEKYYKGSDRTHTRGMGLGLTITRRILELSGGRVEAESPPGEGACFRVWLPLESGAQK